MSYTANVPQSGQSLGTSRPIINSNFSIIQTAFDVDHEDFNAAGAGKHKFVHLTDASSNIPTTAATELAIYNKLVSGAYRIFMRQISSGTQVQLSGRDPTISANGETFLPGGLLIKWGTKLVTSSFTTFTFPTAFPNNCYSVVGTVESTSTSTDASLIVKSVVAAGFDARLADSGGTSRDVFYIAIGN